MEMDQLAKVSHSQINKKKDKNTVTVSQAFADVKKPSLIFTSPN